MDLAGKLEIAGKTDPGKIREHNEDKIGEEVELGAIILADGMGGYHGGEVASAIAVNTILNHLHEHLPAVRCGTRDKQTGVGMEAVVAREAILRANREILAASEAQPQFRGMGTTIVLALFYDNRVAVAHVGDSRMYRLRQGRLDTVTRDHTLLQELVDRGLYSEEEARESLNKNLVTRALGVESEVLIDVQENVAEVGDTYLLCSDGLNDMIDDQEILDAFEQDGPDLQTIADGLVDRAIAAGGRDNVSVVLARVLEPFPAPPKTWYEKVSGYFVNQ
ncbi:MAG TPA: Stp1/IreP family PP2C-type Ser/Thr phosphatase [Gammaproteobacteria bacterium]|nr:Stp1/IreP family PP2C-type Ser/Thr phosphatase [Gammaproteobacteria bacterium]